MPTQLFVFVYWEKGYTNPIRCQRAWAAHRNSTLKGGAATERDGKGLDALATNFNLLTRLASHYPFALFVGDNHVATKRDRKSTRLNSSHGSISYAVFCLKKKTKHT